MAQKYVQPKTLDEVFEGIDCAIKKVESAEWSIERASVNIVCITLGNESLEIQDFYQSFPELVNVVEGAADLEWQTEYDPSGAVITKEEHDQWVQESWQELKDALEATKARYNDNGLSNK